MDDEEQRVPVRKAGTFTIGEGKPIRWTEDGPIEGDWEPSALARAVGTTLRAYRLAAKTLLERKFFDSEAAAPPHLRVPCDILVICCQDGVIVRYDKAGGSEPKVRWTDLQESLVEAAPKFSEQVIHFPRDPLTYAPVTAGPAIEVELKDAMGQSEQIARIHPVVYAALTFPQEFSVPPPPARPPCLVSLHKELQVHVRGEVLPPPLPRQALKPPTDLFLAHGVIALGVGWQAIEVFPLLGEAHWKPEFAAAWAELDLLSAIAQRNSIEAALSRLDGRAAARKRLAETIEELKRLLEGPEEPAHQFLKTHPELLCATYDAAWSKFPFGSHVSDFVFREPHNDYLLVEIEAPYRELFRRDGQQRVALTHAIDQINDWVQHVHENRSVVEAELTGISATPRKLVVIGRSAALTEGNRRKIRTMQTQDPKLAVLTYDDVIERARANAERFFGPMSLTAQGLTLYFFREGSSRTS